MRNVSEKYENMKYENYESAFETLLHTIIYLNEHFLDTEYLNEI